MGPVAASEDVPNGIKSSTDAFVTKAEDMIGKIKKKQATKVNSTIDPAQGVEDVVEGVTNKVKQTLSSKIEMSTNAVMEKAEDMIGKRKKKKKVKSTIDPAAAVEAVVDKVEVVVKGVKGAVVKRGKKATGKIVEKIRTEVKSNVDPVAASEDVPNGIKSSTDAFVTKAKDMIGIIETAGKSTMNDINKAGGIQKALLEGMKVNLNVNPCPGLSGVRYMNCISKNAAKKMKFIGTKVARDFLSETNNMANKISSLGNDVAMHVEKEFLKLNTKSGVMNKDAFSSPVPSYLKSLIACQSLVGFPKIKCIIVRGAGQIHTSGKSNSNAVKKVGLVASSEVLNVANKIKKISGFEKIVKKMNSAAGAMRTKSKSLAETVLKSCRTAEVDILLISSIDPQN